mmetsp:Transcript_85137/g.263617  ORF Transcript_85137/g.263617 Transcript_85137/m.263617 type:complete len:287 (-) Transcript_85137:8-868(-)
MAARTPRGGGGRSRGLRRSRSLRAPQRSPPRTLDIPPPRPLTPRMLRLQPSRVFPQRARLTWRWAAALSWVPAAARCVLSSRALPAPLARTPPVQQERQHQHRGVPRSLSRPPSPPVQTRAMASGCRPEVPERRSPPPSRASPRRARRKWATAGAPPAARARARWARRSSRASPRRAPLPSRTLPRWSTQQRSPCSRASRQRRGRMLAPASTSAIRSTRPTAMRRTCDMAPLPICPSIRVFCSRSACSMRPRLRLQVACCFHPSPPGVAVQSAQPLRSTLSDPHQL